MEASYRILSLAPSAINLQAPYKDDTASLGKRSKRRGSLLLEA
jgi:hypothetical protein